ncbi:Rib/alpha-like domain-containing protein, partial [Anaerococcus tetradius]|uniref:Rib/alpha-like domain-containing protein n=1 Tax=Anaerococcus tetradius TaxID=33036 RepID=UPI0023EFEB7F
LDGKGTTTDKLSYHVNPTKEVTVTAPSVTPLEGYKHTGWDKPLTGTFKNATDITAQYQENDSHKYEPKGQNIRVKKGDNPKAEDGISNKDKLPESTKYDWKKQPDTSTDNTKDATVVVTYPDGSKDEVKVKVIVTIDGSIIRPIPKLESIPEKVDFGGDYNLTDNIKNLPEGASVVDVTPEGVIDVNKTGEYTGKVKVNFKDGSSRVVDVEVIVGKSQADRLTPIIPAEKTGVKNLENLTDKEKEKVKGKIDEANKGNFPDGTKVDVDNKGKATITYPDKSKDIIQATDLVFQYEHGEPAIEEKPEMTIADIIDPSIPEKTEVTDKDKLTDDEKEEVKGKIEEANKDKFPEGTKVVVGKDGGASITYPDGSVDTIQGSDLVIEKTVDNGGNLPGGDDHKTGGDDYKPGDKQTDAEKNPAQKPNKTEVDNPNDLTEEEKDKVKKEVKKVNPKAKDVDVDNKGNATLTYPDGSKNHIPASDTVVEKKKVKPQTKTDAENNPAIIPSDKTGVVDKNNLTDEERREVADKLMKANPKAVDVIVDAQGNARLKYADGSSNHIAASELVFEKAKGGKTVKVPSDSKQANKNVKTGVESLTGVMATLVAAVGGLFASKRKKDEDR